MKFYGTTEWIPKLSNLPHREQKLLWRRAFLRSFRNWQTWAAFAILGVCGGLAATIGTQISDSPFVTGIFGGIGGAIGGFICGQIVSRTARHHVLEELNRLPK
ncbi:MAG TPA: hypothetical protein VMW16_10735 [Sedimentisphaerales bacterium]|nr:hypothetical protein [Sedimentisphaerales bacterium]